MAEQSHDERSMPTTPVDHLAAALWGAGSYPLMEHVLLRLGRIEATLRLAHQQGPQAIATFPALAQLTDHQKQRALQHLKDFDLMEEWAALARPAVSARPLPTQDTCSAAPTGKTPLAVSDEKRLEFRLRCLELATGHYQIGNNAADHVTVAGLFMAFLETGVAPGV